MGIYSASIGHLAVTAMKDVQAVILIVMKIWLFDCNRNLVRFWFMGLALPCSIEDIAIKCLLDNATAGDQGVSCNGPWEH